MKAEQGGYGGVIAGLPGFDGKTDVRLIEGWMRLEHGTLDGLSREELAEELAEVQELVDAFPELSADVARSEGVLS